MAVLRGRLFQVNPAKFKWLGPSPAPQMGSVSARAANLVRERETRLQRACCAVGVGEEEIVFFLLHAHSSRPSGVSQVEMYIYADACQEED